MPSAPPSRAHARPRLAHYPTPQSLDVQRSNFIDLGDGKDETKLEIALSEMLADTQIGFLELGKRLGALGRAELGKALDDWSSAFGDSMPSNERVSQLIFEERVMDLAEFMAVYEAPVDTQMQSQLIWPMDRPLLY